MSDVEICELAAWGFDAYPYRPAALQPLAMPVSTHADLCALQPVPTELQEQLQLQAKRPDLLYEMRGLQWSMGMVDLRALQSFQRRLTLDSQAPRFIVPPVGDLHALLALCLAPAKPLACTVQTPARGIYVVQSGDPNLQVRAGEDGVSTYAGSPFLEVAEFRGRWFLRDGYHRAYRLLQHGVTQVPAVVVHARTLAELGATQPWFFGEDVLFAEHAPRVADFLNASCTIRYTRPRLLRQLRVTVEESFVPATQEGETQ